MLVKTNELTGAALDWAVAKCEGLVDRIELEKVDGVWACAAFEYECMYEPSTDWAQGGPIIEREGISIVAMPNGSWQSQGRNLRPHFHNPTPLIAAMRCYVASNLGDEVEIPNELKG